MVTTGMPRVLIVFATWHGQTEIIARKLGLLARRRGYEAVVQGANEAWARPDLASFDRFVICAGVHMRRHHRAADAFVSAHAELVQSKPSAFVSVSLSAGAPAGSPDRSGVEKLVSAFLDSLNWDPDAVILAAGALHYTRYGLLTRWLMRRISAQHGGPTDTARDYELTDWAQLDRDASSFFPVVQADTKAAHAAAAM